MNANWFDTLTKSVSRPGSRRRAMRLGAALPLAGAAGRLLGTSSVGAEKVSAENCTPEGKRCGKGKRQQPCKKCCTKNVITDQNGRKRCSCVRPGNGCSNDSQCCEGICESGTCRVSDPGPDPVTCTDLKPTATGATQGLQEAIDGAAAGDILRLCAGAWNLTETVVIAKNLTLIGAGTGGQGTVLDGGDTVRVLLVDEANTIATLRDLTITNGKVGDRGAGIRNVATLTLTGVSVTGNAVGIDGGGIINEGTLTLEDTRVADNTAGGGGGGIFNLDATLTLRTGSIVTGNTSRFSGAGIQNDRGTVTLEDGVSLTGNTVQWYGGGITNNEGTVTLRTGASVTDNTAGDAGGGIFNKGTLTLEEGSSVTGNTAVNPGGGILSDSGPVMLQGPDPSPIVVNNCQDNCSGAVAKCAVTPVSCS